MSASQNPKKPLNPVAFLLPYINLLRLCLSKKTGGPMRFPNLRYGNLNEFLHYAQNIPVKDLARRLKRSERSIRNWLSGRQKIPWWIPEIIRLQKMEHDEMLRQMNMQPVRLRLGLAKGSAVVYAFPRVDAPPVVAVFVDEYTMPLFAEL